MKITLSCSAVTTAESCRDNIEFPTKDDILELENTCRYQIPYSGREPILDPKPRLGQTFLSDPAPAIYKITYSHVFVKI